MKRSFFIIALFSFASLAWAQEPKISASTDSVQYKIGAWILLHVDAELPPAVDSLAVAVKDSLGPFEILNVEPSPSKGGHQQWLLRLTIFDTGKVAIPPAIFSYKNRGDTLTRVAYSNSIPLTIVGIPVDLKGDIKDIKPPLDAPWKFEDFLPYLIALAVVALLGFAYWYYRRIKKRRESSYVPPKPIIPPWRVALAALHTIEDQRLWQQGHVKEFYSGVTEVIRRFLEDQYRPFRSRINIRRDHGAAEAGSRGRLAPEGVSILLYNRGPCEVCKVPANAGGKRAGTHMGVSLCAHYDTASDHAIAGRHDAGPRNSGNHRTGGRKCSVMASHTRGFSGSCS